MEQNALPIDQAQIDSLIRAGEMTQHQLGELEKRVTGLEGRQVADNAAIPAIYTINQAGEIVNSNVTELSALAPVKGKFLKVNAATGKLEWAEAGTTLPAKEKDKFLRVGTNVEESLEWVEAANQSAGSIAVEWAKEGESSPTIEVAHTLGKAPTAVLFSFDLSFWGESPPAGLIFMGVTSTASWTTTHFKFFLRSSINLKPGEGPGVHWLAIARG